MPQDTAHPQRAVLIVDEDEEYCAFVSDHLSRAGFASLHVATAADAIDVVGREQPSAVLLEVDLPEACGYEVCHELRQQHGDGLPIVFVSGDRTDPPTVSRACSSEATTTWSSRRIRTSSSHACAGCS